MYPTCTPLQNSTSNYALMIEAKTTGAMPGGTNVLCLTNQITKDHIPPMAFFEL
jgi:hypothetical protein